MTWENIVDSFCLDLPQLKKHVAKYDEHKRRKMVWIRMADTEGENLQELFKIAGDRRGWTFLVNADIIRNWCRALRLTISEGAFNIYWNFFQCSKTGVDFPAVTPTIEDIMNSKKKTSESCIICPPNTTVENINQLIPTLNTFELTDPQKKNVIWIAETTLYKEMNLSRALFITQFSTNFTIKKVYQMKDAVYIFVVQDPIMHISNDNEDDDED